MEEWKDGRMEEWKNGRMEERKNLMIRQWKMFTTETRRAQRKHEDGTIR